MIPNSNRDIPFLCIKKIYIRVPLYLRQTGLAMFFRMFFFAPRFLGRLPNSCSKFEFSFDNKKEKKKSK